MRVLITGASGFVGGWLAERLRAAYPEASLFGTAHGSGTPPAGMECIEADLSDPDAAARVVAASQPTHVFHLAGFASAAGMDVAAITRANVEATERLLIALAERGAPCRVQLASSGYVYGPTPERPARESDPLDARGPYAASKAAMEESARAFASETLSLTATRSFNHTGPRQRPGFVVPDWASQLAAIERGEGPPVMRHGNLGSTRDFLDVRDVVEAYRLLLCETPPAPWRAVNVCSGVGLPMQAVLEGLLAATKVPVRAEVDPAKWRDDAWSCVGDPALLQSLTGWRPRHDFLTETLPLTLSWWRAAPSRPN